MKKEEILCVYLKRKWVRGNDFGSSSQYVNCISEFAFLPVNCFQSFSCAKKEA